MNIEVNVGKATYSEIVEPLGCPPGAARLPLRFFKHKKAREVRALGFPYLHFFGRISEQFLPVLDRLAVAAQLLDDLSGHVRFDLVQQLHRFNDAQHLPHFHRVP